MSETNHHIQPGGSENADRNEERVPVADEKLVNRKEAKHRRNGKPKGPCVEVRPTVLPFFPVGLDVVMYMRAAKWTDPEIDRNEVWAKVFVAEICDERERRGAKPDEFAPVWSRHLLRRIPERMVRGQTLLRRLRETFRPVLEHTDYTRPDHEKRIKGECRMYRLLEPYRSMPKRPITVVSAELCARLSRPPERWERWKNRAECALTDLHREIRTRSEAFYLLDVDAVAEHTDPAALELTGKKPRKFSVCDYGRVHTPVVRCPRELRPYIRVRGHEGMPISSVDVKASQLDIVLLMASGRFTPEAEDLAGLLNSAADWPAEAGGTEEQRRHWLCLKCSQIALNDGFDCRKAFTDPDRDPYLLFAEMLNDGLPAPKYDRAGGKKKLVQLLFIKPELMGHTEEGKVFRGRFPGVFDALLFIKRHLRPKGMSHLAQRAESRIMITGVAGFIVRDRPDLAFATGHDAIYVAQGDGPDDEDVVGYVKGVIQAAREAVLNTPARLEVEPFSQMVKRPKVAGKKRKSKKKENTVKPYQRPSRDWTLAHKRDKPA